MAYLCSHNILFPIGFIVRATVSFVSLLAVTVLDVPVFFRLFTSLTQGCTIWNSTKKGYSR